MKKDFKANIKYAKSQHLKKKDCFFYIWTKYLSELFMYVIYHLSFCLYTTRFALFKFDEWLLDEYTNPCLSASIHSCYISHFPLPFVFLKYVKCSPYNITFYKKTDVKEYKRTEKFKDTISIKVQIMGYIIVFSDH